MDHTRAPSCACDERCYALEMTDTPIEDRPAPVVVNAAEQEEHVHLDGDHWGGSYRVLTPALRGTNGRGMGRLGVNLTPQLLTCPTT